MDDRNDIVIQTARAIRGLIETAGGDYINALGIVDTFIAVAELQQGPKRGRPKNSAKEGAQASPQ